MKPSSRRLLRMYLLFVIAVGVLITVVQLLSNAKQEEAERGPADLSEVHLVAGEDGNPVIVSLAKLTITGLPRGRGVGPLIRHRLDVVDPVRGVLLLRHWWEEDGDLPRCQTGDQQRLWCDSPKLGPHRRAVPTLERVPGEIPDPPANVPPEHHCKAGAAQTPEGTFTIGADSSSARRRVAFRPRGSDERTICAHELIAPHMVCDEHDGTMMVGDAIAVLVAHRSSLVNDDSQLELSAIDGRCRRRWHRVLPGRGEVAWAHLAGGVLVVATSSQLFGIHATSGAVHWQHPL